MRDGELDGPLLALARELCRDLPEADPEDASYGNLTLHAISMLEAVITGQQDRFCASVALATAGGGPEYMRAMFAMAGVAMHAMCEGLYNTGVSPQMWLEDARARMLTEGSL
jgi:hypothetical protein